MTLELPIRIDADADVASFHINGFAGIANFADAPSIARLREHVESLVERRAGRLYGDQFDIVGPDDRADGVNVEQILHASRYAPDIFDSPVRAAGLTLARRILGPDTVFDFDHVLYKRPGNGAGTPWHQDEAYYDGRFEHAVVTIWVPLQDVTSDGGCLEFIPGSHLGGVRPHRPYAGDERMHALECQDVDDRFRVIFPIPAGAATVHHCRVVHFSGANRSATPRYIYAMCFKAPRRETGSDEHAWADARSTASQARFAASRKGRGGLINRALRRASLIVQRANEWNERRTAEFKESS